MASAGIRFYLSELDIVQFLTAHINHQRLALPRARTSSGSINIHLQCSTNLQSLNLDRMKLKFNSMVLVIFQICHASL